MATVNLSATVLGPTSIRLQWQTNHQPGGSWNIFRNGDLVHTNAAGDYDYTDDYVAPGSNYAYQVIDGQCTGCGESLCVQPRQRHDALSSDGSVRPSSPSRLHLADQPHLAGQLLGRAGLPPRGVGGTERPAWAEIATVGANITSYQRNRACLEHPQVLPHPGA